MKIKFTLIILAAVFGLYGCNNTPALQSQLSSSTVTEETATPSGSLVQIMHNEFKPNKLTIKVNTMVSWVNLDSSSHWIISDPHPLHNILPDLDSKNGLNQKEVYQYKFKNVGTFYYHDELNLSITGSVAVEK